MNESLVNRAGDSLVSVIIPCYNRSHFIREAVESVITQTYRPLEILIIDDGSTDGTSEEVQRLAETIKTNEVTLRYIRQENAGAPAARNHGLKIASGEFIQYLDSDDVLLPEKISSQLLLFKESPETDIVYSKAYITTEDLVPTHRFFGRPLTNDGRDLAELRWQTMCSLTRRTFFEKSGNWDESLGKGQEFELNIRSLLAGAQVQFLDKFLAAQRTHGHGHLGASKGLAYLLSAYTHTFSTCIHQIRVSGRLDTASKDAWFWKCANLAWAFGGMGMENDREQVLSLIQKNQLATSQVQKLLLKPQSKYFNLLANKLMKRKKWIIQYLKFPKLPAQNTPVWTTTAWKEPHFRK